MESDYNKELCDERHKNLLEMLAKIDKSVVSLYNRLNWFYLIAITTLISSISAVVLSCAVK